VELDLDHHTRDHRVVAIPELDDSVCAVLGRRHLGQVDRRELDVVVVEHDVRARLQELGRELAAVAE
jgi:hypothetical protein